MQWWAFGNASVYRDQTLNEDKSLHITPPLHKHFVARRRSSPHVVRDLVFRLC